MEYKIMELHQNKDLFRNAVLAAFQRFGIPEIYIEKDYWVTLVLNRIFVFIHGFSSHLFY
ncbi:MAG: hypothetical protein ABIJ59_15180 [Pseudomonadota bacterium]